MATHSSTLAWRIPWTQEPGGLPSTGLHRVGHDWSDLAAAAAAESFPGWYEIWLRLWVSHIWYMTRGNGFLLVASLTFIPQPKWWTLNSCSLTNVYPKEEDLDSNQRNDWPLLRQRLWLLSKKVAQFQINWISTLPRQTSYPYALLERKESHLLPNFWSTFYNSLVQKVSALGSAAGRSNYITLPDPGPQTSLFFWRYNKSGKNTSTTTKQWPNWYKPRRRASVSSVLLFAWKTASMITVQILIYLSKHLSVEQNWIEVIWQKRWPKKYL